MKLLQLGEEIGWGVSLRNHLPLGLDLESSTDWKNLHFIWQLQGKSSFEFKFQLPNTAAHLAITPKGCSSQSKVLSTKSMAELLGQCSSTASDGGQDLQVQTRVFPSRLLSLLACCTKKCCHSEDPLFWSWTVCKFYRQWVVSACDHHYWFLNIKMNLPWILTKCDESSAHQSYET